MLHIIEPNGKDTSMSLLLMIYALMVSILLLITNIPFIEMPWVPWFTPKLTKDLAILNTVINGISLALFPLAYEPKVRPRVMYVFLTILLVFGSFGRMSHQKAPFVNGIIMLCSITGLIIVRWLLRRKKKTN